MCPAVVQLCFASGKICLITVGSKAIATSFGMTATRITLMSKELELVPKYHLLELDRVAQLAKRSLIFLL